MFFTACESISSSVVHCGFFWPVLALEHVKYRGSALALRLIATACSARIPSSKAGGLWAGRPSYTHSWVDTRCHLKFVALSKSVVWFAFFEATGAWWFPILRRLSCLNISFISNSTSSSKIPNRLYRLSVVVKSSYSLIVKMRRSEITRKMFLMTVSNFLVPDCPLAHCQWRGGLLQLTTAALTRPLWIDISRDEGWQGSGEGVILVKRSNRGSESGSE